MRLIQGLTAVGFVIMLIVMIGTMPLLTAPAALSRQCEPAGLLIGGGS